MDARERDEDQALGRVLAALERMESRLSTLEEGARQPAANLHAPSPPSEPAPSKSAPSESAPSEPPSVEDDPRFWVLGGLTERYGTEGVVIFGGQARSGSEGQRAEFQWGRAADHLSAVPWESAADALAALGHPLRLQILQAIHLGTDSVAALVSELQLGSHGLAYHHLNQLIAAGWVTSASRGRYRVPASRVIQLLTIMTALDSFHG